MARIRETFNGKDAVAHAWSRQDQERGREADKLGGRIFFEGPTIFSYGRHFPIATFYQKKGGEKVVLFTTRTYSPTTSAHVFAARGAISHHRIIYCQSPTDAERGIHGDNMKDWEGKAQALAMKLAKATKPEKYLSQIASLRREMLEYAGYFRIGVKKYKFRYLMIESKEGGVKATAKEIADRKRYEKELAARRAKAEAETARAFHAGEVETVRHVSEWTYLRFHAGEIQTSKGIRIEFQEAKEYYSRLQWIRAKCKNSQEYNLFESAPDSMKFQGFDLRSAGPEYFEIGCHKIKWDELDRVAGLAGFTMEAMERIEK